MYQANLQEYRKKVNRYFQYEEDYKPLNREKLYNDFNSAQSLAELDVRIRSYIHESEEAIRLLDPKCDQIGLIVESIELLRKQIIAQSKILPSTPLGNDKAVTNVLEPVKKAVGEQLKMMLKLDQEVFNIKSFTIDSRIAAYHDIGTIRKWLMMENEGKVNLVERAERDGSNFDQFMERSMKLWRSLILARTHTGEVLGVYRITQKGSLSFSLTTKEMKKDHGDPIQKLGMYNASPALQMTWKQKCKYNQKIFDMIEANEIDLPVERMICLGYLNLRSDFLDEKDLKKEDYLRSVLGVEELELFEVQSSAQHFYEPPVE
jgi:hypothetical protein